MHMAALCGFKSSRSAQMRVLGGRVGGNVGWEHNVLHAARHSNWHLAQPVYGRGGHGRVVRGWMKRCRGDVSGCIGCRQPCMPLLAR